MIEVWLLPPALALVAGVLALAPLGDQVLRRGVVFIDLAVAQAAAAGALAAISLADHPSRWVTQAAAACGALLAAAAVSGFARRWPEQREALIGLLYVACACAALLAARRDPHGAEHLHALLAADILWTDWSQAGLLAVCAGVVACIGARLQHDRWFFVSFALVVSLAVQSLGLFVLFAALIAPGLWRRAGYGPVAAAWIGVLAAQGGLLASWLIDAPSGPLVATTLASAGAAASLLRRV